MEIYALLLRLDAAVGPLSRGTEWKITEISTDVEQLKERARLNPKRRAVAKLGELVDIKV